MLKLDTNGQEGTGRKWYLSNEKGLDDVTDKSSNANLGIISMKVTAPTTEKSSTAGVVAHVYLTSIIGSIQVSVFRNDDGDSLRLVVPQDKYEKDGKDAYSDILKFSRPVKAQILRHVHTLCKADAEKPAVAQAQAQAQVSAPAGMDANMMAQFQQFLAFQAMQAGAQAPQASVTPDTPAVLGNAGAGSDTDPF